MSSARQMTPARWQRLAQVAVTVQFLALVRTLGEYYRLRHVHGAAFDAAGAEPYVRGGLAAALGAWVAVTCYFARRYRWVVAVGGGTIVVLLVLRFTLLG